MTAMRSGSPRGLMRWFLRAPIWLYRLHLGWMLGSRFLLLEHTGRKSGLPRRNVLEVVVHDQDDDTYMIASGWGEKSDWFQNILKTPEVQVKVGRREFPARARRMPVDESQAVLLEYAQKHPKAFQSLSRFMIDKELEITPEDCRLLAEKIPLIALEKRRS